MLDVYLHVVPLFVCLDYSVAVSACGIAIFMLCLFFPGVCCLSRPSPHHTAPVVYLTNPPAHVIQTVLI